MGWLMGRNLAINNGELKMNAKHVAALYLSAASVMSIAAAMASEPSVFDDTDRDTLTTLRDTANTIIKYPAQSFGDLKKRFDAVRGGYGKIIDEHVNDVSNTVDRTTGRSIAH